MSGYLGTNHGNTVHNYGEMMVSHPHHNSIGNFGILSSSPRVRQAYARQLEESYLSEIGTKQPPKTIFGKYIYIAGIIQKQLEVILADSLSFERLKEEGVGLNERNITILYFNTPTQDQNDPENRYDSICMTKTLSLINDTQEIIGWVQKNADGPVSVT